MGQCAVEQAKQDVDAMDENDFVDISVNYQSEKTWTAGSKAAEKQKIVTKKRKEAAIRAIAKSYYLRILISDLTPAELDELLNKAEMVDVGRNHVAIKHGIKADACFILLTGNVIEYNEDMRIIQAYDEESCIGDAAFMTGGKHTSTYASGRNSTCYKLTHKNLESITTSVPFIFRKIPMFSGVIDPQKWIQYCSTKKLKPGTEISQLGDSFYFIVCGSLNTTIELLKTGCYFGHQELLNKAGIVDASIIAYSPTLLFIVNAEGFNSPLFEEVRESLRQRSALKTLPEGVEHGLPSEGVNPALFTKNSMSQKKISKSLMRTKSVMGQPEADPGLLDNPWASLGSAWGGNDGGSGNEGPDSKGVDQALSIKKSMSQKKISKSLKRVKSILDQPEADPGLLDNPWASLGSAWGGNDGGSGSGGADLCTAPPSTKVDKLALENTSSGISNWWGVAAQLNSLFTAATDGPVVAMRVPVESASTTKNKRVK